MPPESRHLHFRIAIPNDALRMVEIYNSAINAQNATMDDAPKPPDYFVNLIAGLQDREHYFVVTDRGEVLGWSAIKLWSAKAGYRFTAETSIYLDSTATRKGIGHFLQKKTIHTCRHLGFHHLIARIWRSNEGSIRFHEKFGYRIIGIQEQVGFMNGEWQDVAILQCILAND
ncbi:MAG TPA: N-acetyltransferase family protein [Rhodothermales bacterium]|nr:N-acetyltransferase family protein [Rhodothermales bacterium]